MRRAQAERAILTGLATVLSITGLRFTAGCAPTPTAPAAPAASAAQAATPAADPARAPLQIETIWPAVGLYIKLRDGRLFNVHGPYDWPTFLSDETHVYAPADPVYADMLASLRALRDGPQTPRVSVADATHLLTLGPVVVDPAWDDLVIVRVAKTSPRSFELTLTKHGISLSAAVGRATNHDYRVDYQHYSSGWIEGYRPDTSELATHLERARLGAGVDPGLRDQAVRLLRKPTTTTAGPDEP